MLIQMIPEACNAALRYDNSASQVLSREGALQITDKSCLRH